MESGWFHGFSKGQRTARGNHQKHDAVRLQAGRRCRYATYFCHHVGKKAAGAFHLYSGRSQNITRKIEHQNREHHLKVAMKELRYVCCKICGMKWNIAKGQDTKNGYVCPHCIYERKKKRGHEKRSGAAGIEGRKENQAHSTEGDWWGQWLHQQRQSRRFISARIYSADGSRVCGELPIQRDFGKGIRREGQTCLIWKKSWSFVLWSRHLLEFVFACWWMKTEDWKRRTGSGGRDMQGNITEDEEKKREAYVKEKTRERKSKSFKQYYEKK